MNPSPAPLWCLVPAAGLGSRMQAEVPKQYLPLAGQTLLEVTLQRLLQLPGLTGIMVALSPEDRWFDQLPLARHRQIWRTQGGDTRADSVCRGLLALRAQGAAADDWVLVHDAARPCVTLAAIGRLLSGVKAAGRGGLLAVPVADTLKQQAPGQPHCVASTLDRSRIWQAHTPQVFPLGLLLEALQAGLAQGLQITDEASALEAYGHSPLLVEDRRDNIKITRPEDLPLAEYLLQQQAGDSL
jgi:2-C-methyl-D-erythritol 4-phosphate cytidylyltransferase